MTRQGDPSIIRVYVDETGDRGMKPRSSPYFTMVAVMVRDTNDHLLMDYPERVRTAIAKPADTKFKWTDLAHLQRRVAVTSLASLPVRLIYVCIPKANIRPGTALGTQTGAFYNYAARFVIERVSWFAAFHRCTAHLTFERVRGFDPSVLKEYVALLRSTTRTAHWQHISPNVLVDSPANIRSLIAADVAAGAYDSATRPDLATNLVEESYLRTLAPRIWCGPTGRAITTGLKILGGPAPIDRLPWWPMPEIGTAP